jgi:hypothetical protein
MSHAVWVSTVSVYTTLQDVRDAEMYALAPGMSTEKPISCVGHEHRSSVRMLRLAICSELTREGSNDNEIPSRPTRVANIQQRI